MTPEFITVFREGSVTRITLNRPAVMNALHTPMHFELQAAFDAFEADPGQRICVVTGAGDRAFCAGSDLKYTAAMTAAGKAEEVRYPPSGYAGLIERTDITKPLIAAVNGLALGGGFEIVLSCDIVIAASTARFGLPEPLVGAVALGGGIHRLARQIGLKQAMGMILTSRPVDAAEGHRLGFVNAVVAPADLDAEVDRWVADILRGAPLSIQASKQAVMMGLDETHLIDALRGQEDYPAFAHWRRSEDAVEGPRAFAEKRPPVWKGG